MMVSPHRAQSGLSQEGNLAINVKTVRTRGSMDRIFILVLNITTDFVEKKHTPKKFNVSR